LILRKISKIGARCQILRLNCTKFDFCQTRWRSLQRSPDLLAVFKGPTSKWREGKGRGERKGKGGPPFRVVIGSPKG